MLALLVCYFCFSYNTASAQNFATGSDCPTYYTGSNVNDEDYPIPSGTGTYSNSVICNQVSIQDLEAIVYPTIPTYNGTPLGAYNPDTGAFIFNNTTTNQMAVASFAINEALQASGVGLQFRGFTYEWEIKKPSSGSQLSVKVRIFSNDSSGIAGSEGGRKKIYSSATYNYTGTISDWTHYEDTSSGIPPWAIPFRDAWTAELQVSGYDSTGQQGIRNVRYTFTYNPVVGHENDFDQNHSYISFDEECAADPQYHPACVGYVETETEVHDGTETNETMNDGTTTASTDGINADGTISDMSKIAGIIIDNHEDDMMNDGSMMADGSIIDDGSKSGDMGMDMMGMAEQDSTGALLLIELEREHMDDMYPETILISEEDLHMMMEQEMIDMEMMEKIESIEQIDIAMMEEMMEHDANMLDMTELDMLDIPLEELEIIHNDIAILDMTEIMPGPELLHEHDMPPLPEISIITDKPLLMPSIAERHNPETEAIREQTIIAIEPPESMKHENEEREITELPEVELLPEIEPTPSGPALTPSGPPIANRLSRSTAPSLTANQRSALSAAARTTHAAQSLASNQAVSSITSGLAQVQNEDALAVGGSSVSVSDGVTNSTGIIGSAGSTSQTFASLSTSGASSVGNINSNQSSSGSSTFGNTGGSNASGNNGSSSSSQQNFNATGQSNGNMQSSGGNNGSQSGSNDGTQIASNSANQSSSGQDGSSQHITSNSQSGANNNFSSQSNSDATGSSQSNTGQEDLNKIQQGLTGNPSTAIAQVKIPQLNFTVKEMIESIIKQKLAEARMMASENMKSVSQEELKNQQRLEDKLVKDALSGSTDEDAQAALLGFNPRFRAYQQKGMRDVAFYVTKDIYTSSRNYDNPNQRFFNGASDVKHREMVRQQYDR